MISVTDDGSQLFLDGNAAASALQEIFVLDVTSAQVRCGTCDSTGAVGSMRLYAAAMGAVLRCVHCDAILVRVVHTPHGSWLEMTGARYLRF
jgi:hypothetical protein